MSRKKSSNIPNTSNWLPRESAADCLQNAFANSCHGADNVIRIKSQLENK